jgi:hypothetical protein
MTKPDKPEGAKPLISEGGKKPAIPSLSEALAAHERRKAQLAEHQVNHAEEIAAKSATRAALQAKLDALPQHERRQVLDAAGQKHVSAAPPPLSPVGGSYAPAKPKAPDVSKPDWRFWTKIKAVKVWQAIVLSLDIDPDGMKHHPDAWMAGPGNGPIFEDRSFPSNAVKVEYGKRVRLLRSEITNPDYFYRHKINSNGALCEIYLRDFVKWAVTIDLGEMPPELVAMAQSNLQPASKPRAAPIESKAPDKANAQGNLRTIQATTTKRSDALTAVIAVATKSAQNPVDYHSVWAALVVLAESDKRPAPLIGFAEGEGVKYQGEKDVEFFTKRNLSDRMRRAKPR